MKFEVPHSWYNSTEIFLVVAIIFLSVIVISEFDAHIQEPHDEEGLEEEDPNPIFSWAGVEVEDPFASFPCAPQKIPRCLLKVGLIAVFAGEGPKKGVGLINGLWLVGLTWGGGGVFIHRVVMSISLGNVHFAWQASPIV